MTFELLVFIRLENKLIVFVTHPEIVSRLTDLFLDFGVDQIFLSRKNICEEFFNKRYEANYIEKILKEHLKVDQYHELDDQNKDLFGNPQKKYKVIRYSYPKWDIKVQDGKRETVRVEVSDVGRPFVFKREDFVKDYNIEITPEQLFLKETIRPVQAHNGVNGSSQHKETTDNLPFG